MDENTVQLSVELAGWQHDPSSSKLSANSGSSTSLSSPWMFGKYSCWEKSSDNNSKQFVKSSAWHCTAYVRLLFPGKWPTAERRRGILAPTCFSAVCHHHISAAYGGGDSSAQGPLYFGQLVTAWQMMSYSFYVSRMRAVVCVFQSLRVSAWKLESHLGVYCWIRAACCITRILSLCTETTVDWINSRSASWHEGEPHTDVEPF